MNNKRHFRLDPKSSEYDEFYIINYASVTKSITISHSQFAINEDINETDDTISDINDEDAEPLSVECIFCTNFYEPVFCFEHCKIVHDWDIKKIQKDYSLDVYGAIRVINYSRKTKKKSIPAETDSFWKEPGWLIPVVPDDALIICLSEVIEDPRL
ncbi:Zinc finger protein C19B12.07c [Schizosaccharomyces pombe]